MKHDDKTNSAERIQRGAQWHLDGWYAIKADTRERVYVRDLLDVGSYEFEHSKLTYKQRLDIITSIGVPNVLAVMQEIAVEKGSEPYLQQTFEVDMALLLNFTKSI